jgi:hypothetical protein
MWLSAIWPEFIAQGEIYTTDWANILVLTSLTVSLTVNALVTGLIVFRIFKVFLEVRDVTGGRKLRSIIFIIIESAMTLFAIQLARIVITIIGAEENALALVAGIHEMLNVIISSVIATLYFTDNVWIWLGYDTYHHPGTGVIGIVFPRRAIIGRSCQQFGI